MSRPATQAQHALLISLGHEINESGYFEVGGLVVRAGRDSRLSFYEAERAIQYAQRAAAGHPVDPDGWGS